jgi:hypothetical protein
MVMKATWLFGLVLGLVVLLSACSQNTVPEASLEPEAELVDFSHLRIRDSFFDKIPTNFCQRYYPVCELQIDPDILQEVIPCFSITCHYPVDVFVEETYRLGLILPELGQTPTQFAKSFKLDLLDSSGKVIARGLPNPKAPALEVSAKLPKGTYALRVQVLDKSVAKLLQTSPSKYPLGFLTGFTK